MIFDRAQQTIIGNLGWVDQGAIWQFDLHSHAQSQVAVEGADYLTLKEGSHGFFRLTHHMSDTVFASVRRTANPHEALATLKWDGAEPRIDGDVEAWSLVEPCLLVQSALGPRLFLVDAVTGRARGLDLSWYNGDSFDLGYQGLTDSILLADRRRAVVSVQRSSELVIIDLASNQKGGLINLGGRGGNPDLHLLPDATFLASDYDTLCRVNAGRIFRKVVRKLRLQESVAGTMQFIGNFYVAGAHCAVARPFSNDVLLIDLEKFRITAQAPVECQPIDVCMTSATDFVVRDWKTGTVEIGAFS